MPVSRKRKTLQNRKTRGSREEAIQRKARVIPRSLSDLERISGSHPEVFALHLGVLFAKRRKTHLDDLLRFRENAWRGLSQVPQADALLSHCGATWPADQVLPRTNDFGSHLRWSLDQYVEIHRLIRAGLIYGAFVTTRMFLERWTMNVAASHELEQASDENEREFISRVWKRLEPLVDRDIGADWAWLSEGIHGRDPLGTLGGHFDATNGFGATSAEVGALEDRLIQIASSVATQLFVGIEFNAQQKKQKGALRILGSFPRFIPPSVQHNLEELQYLGQITQPLDPMTAFSDKSELIMKYGAGYRKAISTQNSQLVVTRVNLPFHLVGALLERRTRSIELARKGLIHEADLTDPEEGHARLYGRLYRYAAISEAAFLVALECDDIHEAAALRSAALALNSSWQLWLDDTDIALGCLRGLVEQTARARTHRLKPLKADKFEQTAQPPQRWVEAAGLGRINPTLRALGEFAHLKFTTKRHSARELLVDIQSDDEPHPINTARRAALNASAYLLAREIGSRLDGKFPRLGENFRRYVTFMDEDGHERFENDLLEKSLCQKYRKWGDPDFVRT